MSAAYNYLKNGRQFGPVSAQELKALADAGQLLPTDLVWKNGAFGDRRRAAEFPGLFPNRPPAAGESPRPAAAIPAQAAVGRTRPQAAAPRPEGTPGGPCNLCHQRKPDVDVCYLKVVAEQLSKWGAVLALVRGLFNLGTDAWQRETLVLRCRCCESCYRKGRRVRSARWQVPLLTFLVAALVLGAGLGLAWVTTPPVAPGEELPLAMGVMVLSSWAALAGVLLLYPVFLGRVTRRRIKALLDPATEAQVKALIGIREWGWRKYLVVQPERPEDEDVEPFETALGESRQDVRGSDLSPGYFYAQGGQRVGPVSFPKLQALADAGQLLPGDPVWKQGTPDWRPAAEFEGLFGDRPRAAAPAARPGARPSPALPEAEPVALARYGVVPTGRAPGWMLALVTLILVIWWGLTAALVLGGEFATSDAQQTIVVVVSVLSLIPLGILAFAIERRTAQPYKFIRVGAIGAFCLGVLGVIMSSYHKTVNVRGFTFGGKEHVLAKEEVMVLSGPQNWYDVLLLDYGLALLLVAAVTFLLPNLLTATVTGLGILGAGIIQGSFAILAMTGAGQLRAVDDVGQLWEGTAVLPVITLVTGIILVIAGIAVLVLPWRSKSWLETATPGG